MMAVNRYFGSIPKPNATTRPGAMATTGVTFRTTASGINARSTTRTSAMTTARTNAAPMPHAAPTAISCSVTTALSQKTAGESQMLEKISGIVGRTYGLLTA